MGGIWWILFLSQLSQSFKVKINGFFIHKIGKKEDQDQEEEEEESKFN